MNVNNSFLVSTNLWPLMILWNSLKINFCQWLYEHVHGYRDTICLTDSFVFTLGHCLNF